MIEVKGDWKDESILRTIWKTHFSGKTMPKIQVCVMSPEEYLKARVQVEACKHTRARELMMQEYGYEVAPEKRVAFVFYYKCEDIHCILMRNDSKLTDEYLIKQEMRHIFQRIDIEGHYIGAIGEPTHPKRPSKTAFRNLPR